MCCVTPSYSVTLGGMREYTKLNINGIISYIKVFFSFKRYVFLTKDLRRDLKLSICQKSSRGSRSTINAIGGEFDSHSGI